MVLSWNKKLLALLAILAVAHVVLVTIVENQIRPTNEVRANITPYGGAGAGDGHNH
jgi:hypothetical protein